MRPDSCDTTFSDSDPRPILISTTIDHGCDPDGQLGTIYGELEPASETFMGVGWMVAQ